MKHEIEKEEEEVGSETTQDGRTPGSVSNDGTTVTVEGGKAGMSDSLPNLIIPPGVTTAALLPPGLNSNSSMRAMTPIKVRADRSIYLRWVYHPAHHRGWS